MEYSRSARRIKSRSSLRSLVIIATVSLLSLALLALLALIAGIFIVLGSGRILPGVSSMGLSLNGLDADTAAAEIAAVTGKNSAFQTMTITLILGSRTWQISAQQLGIAVDARATAATAQGYGRRAGSFLNGIFGAVVIPPVMTINRSVLAQNLQQIEPQIDVLPINATIHLVNGTVQSVPAQDGYKLAIDATIDQFLQAPLVNLKAATIQLITSPVQPDVTDASDLMNRAYTLLASPLTITAYDPIVNEQTVWTIPADQWGPWLTTTEDKSGATFSIAHDPFVAYLGAQPLTDGRFLNMDESVKAVQTALATDSTSVTLRIYHPATTHKVVAGDSLDGIAMQVGIPNWQIEQVNPGLNPAALAPGQVITIPSQDVMIPLPVIPNKRIKVSISRQHMTVYENGAVKWDWTASTGIPDSPTMPGVYQIQSHTVDAHSTPLNMNMPDFMGFYDAQPGFTNGIHGFPSRDGVGVMWQNDLGHVITFGCVLLSTDNAQLLYNWAEDGVIIEIQP